MARIILPANEMPQDPPLLGVQGFLKDVADEILEQRTEDNRALFYETKVDVDPVELQSTLRDTNVYPVIGRLMLADGDSLSAVPPNKLQPNLNLYVDDDNLRGVSVRAWGREDDKSRFVTVGDEGPRDNFVVFEGETDWTRSLYVKLHYSDGRQRAIQQLSISTSSEKAGILPWFGRDVITPAYADMGYNGHNEKVAQSRALRETALFILTVSDLFDRRV